MHKGDWPVQAGGVGWGKGEGGAWAGQVTGAAVPAGTSPSGDGGAGAACRCCASEGGWVGAASWHVKPCRRSGARFDRSSSPAGCSSPAAACYATLPPETGHNCQRRPFLSVHEGQCRAAAAEAATEHVPGWPPGRALHPAACVLAGPAAVPVAPVDLLRVDLLPRSPAPAAMLRAMLQAALLPARPLWLAACQR